MNAYLIRTESGFVLVDTGMRRHRDALVRALQEEGCRAGTLALTFITHGDFDHIGSAAHLRDAFGSPIAMHADDVPMAEIGDAFAGRRRPNRVVRTLLPLVVRLPQEDRFRPDVPLFEGRDLSEYGLPGASVVVLHGHSAGSVGLRLFDGSFFCGDVLENRRRPQLGSIMDDMGTARKGLQRLRTLGITTVFPGHGAPFRLEEIAPTP